MSLMKVEVQYVGDSVDVDTYEGVHVGWAHQEGQVHIYAGASLAKAPKVASYPEGRIVRIRVIE